MSVVLQNSVSYSDKCFYTHEIRELERYRALGYADSETNSEIWNNTHSATLEDYKRSSELLNLYTQEALDAYDKQEEVMKK